MKNILIIFCVLFIGNNLFSQVLDIVQQTWYLRQVQLDNIQFYVPYGEIIELNFAGINPNYTVSTNGIENIFSANANFNNSEVTFSNSEVTSSNCTASNCDFENLYFYQFLSNQALEAKTFTYFYMVFSSGRKLFRITDTNGNRAEFTDQPLEEVDPVLFQTWYLHAMEADLGDTEYIADYDPPIAPTITINPDLSFTGIGSCNEFSGNFDYTEYPNDGLMLVPKNFDATTENCQHHSDFENYYFFHFTSNQPLRYIAGEDQSNGEGYFSFELMPGFTFIFFNYPVLSVPESEKKFFTIYPNPANEKLFIKTSENNLLISIADINGRTVISINNLVSNTIDISALKSGMYFITITSSEGKSTKKFIKT